MENPTPGSEVNLQIKVLPTGECQASLFMKGEGEHLALMLATSLVSQPNAIQVISLFMAALQPEFLMMAGMSVDSIRTIYDHSGRHN